MHVFTADPRGQKPKPNMLEKVLLFTPSDDNWPLAKMLPAKKNAPRLPPSPRAIWVGRATTSGGIPRKAPPPKCCRQTASSARLTRPTQPIPSAQLIPPLIDENSLGFCQSTVFCFSRSARLARPTQPIPSAQLIPPLIDENSSGFCKSAVFCFPGRPG